MVTLAVVLPLLAVFVLADEMDAVGTAGYGLAEALWFVTLSLPRYAYQVFPLATLIGALVGLGQLAARSELVAMRAAGLSIARIVRGALLGGLVLALTAVAIGELVAPPAEQRALSVRASAKTGDAVQVTGSGFWVRDGDAFINVRGIVAGADLSDIDIFLVEGSRLTTAAHAEQARYEDGRWALSGIDLSRIVDRGGGERVETEHREQVRWESLIDPELLEVIVVEPQLLPVWGLHRYIRYMRRSQQDPGPYEVAFWGKVVHPLLTLAMIFVAIPVLLGSARTTSTGVKVFIGILIGITFYVISRTFSYLALLYQLDPALAAFSPPLLFVFAGVLLLRRVG